MHPNPKSNCYGTVFQENTQLVQKNKNTLVCFIFHRLVSEICLQIKTDVRRTMCAVLASPTSTAAKVWLFAGGGEFGTCCKQIIDLQFTMVNTQYASYIIRSKQGAIFALLGEQSRPGPQTYLRVNQPQKGQCKTTGK